jgi:hypothetical protein
MAEIVARVPLIMILTTCFRNVIKDFPEEIRKVTNGDTFLVSLLGSYGKGKYLTTIHPAAYRRHEGGIWSSKTDQDKKITLITTFYWLSQYYKRIGKNDFARSYLDHIRNHINDIQPKETGETIQAQLNLSGRFEESLIRFIKSIFRFCKSIKILK